MSAATILDDSGACEVLSITKCQLKTLRLRRQIPHIRVGYRTVRYRLADIQSYIERQRVPATWEG